MAFTSDQIEALKAPLSTTAVRTRSQAGRNLSYVEGWHAIAEANRIFGFDGWDRETTDLALLGEPRQLGDKYRVGYRAKVRICVRTADGMVVRDGCGFGSGIDKDLDQAHESALKEAETDAMKRALMTFGNPFGLALYDKEQRNVAEPERPAPRLVQPARDPQPAADVVEYVTKAKATIATLGAASEVYEWFRDEAGRRNALGIGKDTAAYQTIVQACEKRRDEVSSDQGRAA